MRDIRAYLGITTPKAIPSFREVGKNLGARNFDSWSRAVKEIARMER